MGSAIPDAAALTSLRSTARCALTTLVISDFAVLVVEPDPNIIKIVDAPPVLGGFNKPSNILM